MRNIKRLICILISVLICFAFTGCDDTEQADELILIHSIGIDKSEDGYKITMQIYDTTKAEGKAVASVIGENIKIITAQSDTIYSALRQSEMTQGEKFFTGHNMLIVLGESVIKEDIHKVLNYFVYDDLTFNGIIIATTYGNASDIINAKIDNDILSASSMAEIINKSVYCSKAVNPQLLGIVGDLTNQKSTTVLPVLSIEKDNGAKVFKVASTAVIKNSVLVGTLNHDETIGLNILTGKAKTVSLCVKVDGMEVVTYLDHLKVKLRPDIVDGNVVMKTSISYDIIKKEMLGDFNTSFYLPYNKLKNAVEAKVMEECKGCIDKVIREYKADVLDIEQYLKFYKKDYFSQAKNDYDTMLSNLTYDITIKSQVVD